jgi:PAS domain S-box-containing protein
LKTRTGFDAVGIRLQDGDDFPYLAQEGFPEDFLLTENTLTERGADGGVCRDGDGNASLECTCGLVISGKTDPANPLFTAAGSFWTNDSCSLLDIPPGEDPRRHPRNQCIHHGYASVALVPIRNKYQNVGLIQLNDRRRGCFTLERVELLEAIGSHIGAALMRTQAEEALRASEERHRAILETAMNGFWLVDIQGRLLQVNEAYCRMSGYSAVELLALRIPDLESAETADDCAAHIQTVMAQGEDRFESRHRRKDGSVFDVEVSVQYQPGESGAFVVFLRDITERKRFDQALDRARNEAVTEKAHLEVVARALSESEAALQRANNDLKTANAALRRINETLEARVATRTATLAQRTDQLRALAGDLTRAEERERRKISEVIHDQLQQLLSVARIKLGMALGQAGTRSHQQSLSEVDDLIAESLDITRTLTAELSPAILRRSGLAAALRWLGRWYEARFALNVAVEVEEDMDVEEEVRVALFRSVRELLFNVVKHAGVTSARVRLDREADGRVRILVSDDGAGFDPEPVRAREGTSGSFGLFSLRERLELLGGQFEVDSAPGRGASFTMIAPLPRRAGPEAPAPAAASTTPLAIAVGIHTGARRRPPRRKKGPV